MASRRNYSPKQNFRQTRRQTSLQRVGWSPRARRLQFGARNIADPFSPPEDWHEPAEDGRDYRIIVQSPGEGYRHVVTPEEIRERLSRLPQHFTKDLEVVQLSRITRKKQSFPCYGMQWGATLYLYPLEESLEECFYTPPRPAVINEANMFGGRWDRPDHQTWRLTWTQETIRDFYLNNILIHELGHLLDDRNTSYIDRERYAEWFAIQYGYLPTRTAEKRAKPVRKRHHNN